MVRTMKAQQPASEQDVAQATAKGMQQKIEDPLIDASFRDEHLQFLTNFAIPVRGDDRSDTGNAPRLRAAWCEPEADL